MNKPASFVERIQAHYEQLSPNSRKVANYLQHNPLDVINTSVAEIAELTQTSKATVSRFFRQLGYASHLDVKRELRALRATGLPVGNLEIDNDYVNQELERIQQTWSNVDSKELDAIIEAIDRASRITLIGFRNSYPVAMHFRQQLLQIRDKVRLLPQPGQTLSEELLDIAADELVILVGFRRRPRIIKQLIEQLTNNTVCMLGDPSAQVYKSQVSHLLICQLGQEMPLDSYAAPMSVVSVVCNGVLSKRREGATARISAISQLYRDLDELE